MKKEVIYVFPQLYAFGELSFQIWALRNIFFGHKINLITYPLQKLRINNSLFNIATRGINVIHSLDDNLIWYSEDCNHPSVFEDDKFIYYNSRVLKAKFMEIIQNKQPAYYFHLNKAEKKKGEQLKKKFGIPVDAPIVTLHIRESGFKNSHGVKEGPDGPFRNANILNYLLAINYLIKKGYYVVRLGDKTMTPFQKIKNFIDAPFHPSYTCLVDPYFIANSKFIIGMASGPLTIADAFNIPRLCLNYPILRDVWAWNKDLFVFKKYFHTKLKRFLTYEEILTSNVIHIYNINEAKKNNIQLFENSPEEILAATKEMIARLNGNYFSINEMKGINHLFIKIQKKASKIHTKSYIPLLNFFDINKVPISMEYLRMNSYLINN